MCGEHTFLIDTNYAYHGYVRNPNGEIATVDPAGSVFTWSSDGVAPSALMQRGPAFSPPQVGPKRSPRRQDSLPTGGLAVFRILLVMVSGTTKSAILRVNCALGEVPAEHSVEGIQLLFEGNGVNYSEPVSGRLMFLSARSEVSARRKPEQAEDTYQVVQPQSN